MKGGRSEKGTKGKRSERREKTPGYEMLWRNQPSEGNFLVGKSWLVSHSPILAAIASPSLVFHFRLPALAFLSLFF
jgi:hypothetical protein